MTNWQRLEQVVKWSGMSTNKFATVIGLKRSENLYQIKRGNFGISKELARLINGYYPGISKLWLLTGEGEMLHAREIDIDLINAFNQLGVNLDSIAESMTIIRRYI